MAEYTRGSLVAEGKTKRIFEAKEDFRKALVDSKDDITGGNGKLHEIVPGKGALSTRTTANVFRTANECGMQTAFIRQIDPTTFLAHRGRMRLWEVVIRREAHGSELQRNPHFHKGLLFPRLVVQFFLKTSGRNWKGHPLVCDDPYAVLDPKNRQIKLYDAHAPLKGQDPFLILPQEEVFEGNDDWPMFAQMDRSARLFFLTLEKMHELTGRRLVDVKIEFDDEGRISDVVESDSWRVIQDGEYGDKELFRLGRPIAEVMKKFELGALLSDRFGVPRQRIILWKGSDNDDTTVFKTAIGDIVDVEEVSCSMHKKAVAGSIRLQQLLHEVPDSVVIAYIGMSNGAAPMLSAMCTNPVIAVPATLKDCPQDVYSSLRAPSNVPVMTVIDPKNAVLAALGILSVRNPKIYAHRRFAIEENIVNVMEI